MTSGRFIIIFIQDLLLHNIEFDVRQFQKAVQSIFFFEKFVFFY